MIIPVMLASPYAGLVQRNKAYLQLCIRDSLFRGEAPFCPHQMYTDAIDDKVEEERSHGIEAGLRWAKFAKRTVVYTDLGISRGMQYEISRAEEEARPVEYRGLKDFDLREFFTEFDEETETPWEELFMREQMRALGKKQVHGACVIVLKQNPEKPGEPLVLAVEGPKGTGLPGGKIDFGERPATAAMRELLEETGLALKAGASQAMLPVKPTDNGDIAHGFWVDARETFGELRSSPEGRPLWLPPWALVKDRPGCPPVRFPLYNLWALRSVGLLPEGGEKK